MSAEMAPARTAGKTPLQLLEEEFGDAQMARAPYEGVWYLNLAYYEGEQWLAWDGNRLYKPKLRKGRVLITDNRIQPAIRTEVAKLTKNKPTWDVTPDAATDEALEGARRSQRVLDAKWAPDELALSAKLRRALEWSRICGKGFWKVTWDSSLGHGTEVLVGPDGKVVRGTDNGPLDPALLDAMPEDHPMRAEMKRQMVHKGDVRIDVRSPFQVFPDPLAESLDECEKFYEEVIHSPDYVKSRYGVDLKPDAEFTSGMVEARLSKSRTASKSGVRVREMWQRSTSTRPQGRHVVWVTNKILVDEENPYLDDEGRACIPYVEFIGIDVPGRFWATSTAEQLRPVQTELNKVKSQKAENRNRFGNPSMLKSRQSSVKYTGLPGETIEYDDTTQNAVPSFLTPPEMPAYVQQEIAEMEQAIQEISGQHEVSSGSVPAGVTAAAAINLLQEGDDTKLGPSVDDMESALSLAGTMVLRLIDRYYTDERMVRITGEDENLDVFRFTGSMLNGQTQARVTPGAMAPRSKAAKQAVMQDMFQLMIQYGIRFEQRALRKFFQQWEVGGLESLLGDLDRDEAQVNREHRKLYNGEPLEVNQLVDNHEAHIAGHREEMKTARYEDEVRRNPTIRAAAEAHLKTHLDAAAAMAPPPVDEQGNPLPVPPAPPVPSSVPPEMEALMQALSGTGVTVTPPSQ